MLASWLLALFSASAALAYVDDETTRELLYSGEPQIGVWMAINEGLGARRADVADDRKWKTDLPMGTLTDDPPSNNNYKAYCFPQPVSHFDSSAGPDFCQRYWVRTTMYKPGGPVFLHDPGEGAADGFFTYNNRMWQMADKLNGAFIVLEHRYYGWSMPVPDLTTDNLRFLNQDEAFEDKANFIRNWQPPIDLNITDPTVFHPQNSPWIYTGGSHAGARAAHMRVLYPDIVFGAIASSATTLVKASFPEYYDAFAKYGDQDCVKTLASAVDTIDGILDQGGNAAYELKTLFGLQMLNDVAFANAIAFPRGAWQDQSRVHEVLGWTNNKLVHIFCPAILKPGEPVTIVNGTIELPPSIPAYAQYFQDNTNPACRGYEQRCYGFNPENHLKFDTGQEWRIWIWQVCTELGSFAPAHTTGQRLTSLRLDYNYQSRLCRYAFPPGEHFRVPDLPNVDAINRLGGLAIAADRLAIINGERDLWRPLTPGADNAPPRVSSLTRPFYLIPHAVHVWEMYRDPYGIDRPPQYMKDIHNYYDEFVEHWLKQWGQPDQPDRRKQCRVRGTQV